MLNKIMFVLLGGGMGACCRELFMLSVPAMADHFPLSIFLANVIAAFLIGLFGGLSEKEGPVNSHLKLLMSTGILGGLSTFSTYMLDTVHLLRNPATFYMALVYILGTIFMGYICVRFGLYLGRIRPSQSKENNS